MRLPRASPECQEATPDKAPHGATSPWPPPPNGVEDQLASQLPSTRKGGGQRGRSHTRSYPTCETPANLSPHDVPSWPGDGEAWAHTHFMPYLRHMPRDNGVADKMWLLVRTINLKQKPVGCGKYELKLVHLLCAIEATHRHSNNRKMVNNEKINRWAETAFAVSRNAEHQRVSQKEKLRRRPQSVQRHNDATTTARLHRSRTSNDCPQNVGDIVTPIK
jgi:hypothetical protein